MNRNLIIFVAFFLLAMLESLLTRWLTWPVVLPLVLPVLLALAPTLPVRTLLSVTIVAGLAKEIWSGMPEGMVLLVLVGVTGSVALFSRWWRSALPTPLHAVLAALATSLFLLLLHLLTKGPLSDFYSSVRAYLLPSVITPALWGGLLSGSIAYWGIAGERGLLSQFFGIHVSTPVVPALTRR